MYKKIGRTKKMRWINSGDDAGDMAYNLPDSAAVFLAGVQYAIQFIRATP